MPSQKIFPIICHLIMLQDFVENDISTMANVFKPILIKPPQFKVEMSRSPFQNF